MPDQHVSQAPMYIDPHIHMISRTVDDYEAMRAAGIVAVIEPAFWMGQPRTSIGSMQDYFASLLGWERFRAGQFGIRHYCTLGLNSKEANNERLAEETLDILPLYLGKEGVVAIGEAPAGRNRRGIRLTGASVGTVRRGRRHRCGQHPPRRRDARSGRR